MIPLYIPEMTILATRNFLSTNLSFYDQDVYIHIYDHLQLQEREENSCSLAFNFQLVPFLVTRNFSSFFFDCVKKDTADCLTRRNFLSASFYFVHVNCCISNIS